MAFDFDLLTCELSNRVLEVTIDAPPMHVMTVPLYHELVALSLEVEELADDISVMVLRSADPDFFIAHFDVETLKDAPFEAESPPERDSGLKTFHQMCERFRTMPVVTIAEIDGRVGGGGAELAASFDMRFGSVERMVLNQMEVPLGILPGGSGTQRLPHLVGRGRAMEIVLGAIDVDAIDATKWGWLNRAFPAAEMRLYVDWLARRIASFPAHAVQAAKASMLAAIGDPIEGLLDEAHLFAGTMQQPSTREIMARFLDAGGQTREAELHMQDLTAKLHD